MFIHIDLSLDYEIEVVRYWAFTNYSFFLNLCRNGIQFFLWVFHYFLVLDSVFSWFWLFCWFIGFLWILFWLHFLWFVFSTSLVSIFSYRLWLALFVKIIEIFFRVQIDKLNLWGRLFVLIDRVLDLTFWNIIHIVNIYSSTYLKFI